jgi:hypothetical protein
MGFININILARGNQSPDSSGWISISIDYNSTHVFTLENFTTETTPPYSDPENDNLQSIKITSLPVVGQLLKGLIPVLVDDVIDYNELLAGDLTYVSDIANTEGYTDGFTEFLVSDQGSLLFSISPNPVTFLVGEQPEIQLEGIFDLSFDVTFN